MIDALLDFCLLQATGRKKLLMAGIVTDVCVLFPALHALAEGYDVYIVVDACGTFNDQVARAALQRAEAAGAILVNWFAVAAELQSDWRGWQNGVGLAKLLATNLPEYGNLITSWSGAYNASNNATSKSATKTSTEAARP